MTAATLTIQSANQQQNVNGSRIALAEIKRAGERAKAAAATAAGQAKEGARNQARVAVEVLMVSAPLLVLLFGALALSHFNFMVLAKLFPVCLFAFLGFGVLSVLNPGASRTEP